MPDAANLDFLKELKATPGSLGEWLNRLAHLAKRMNVIETGLDDVEPNLYPIKFNNTSGAIVPAGGIIVPAAGATVEGTIGIDATKVDDKWPWTMYVNSMFPVAIGGMGRCSLATLPVLIRRAGTVVPGDRFGPTINSFLPTANRNGFICASGPRTIGAESYVLAVQNFPQTFFGKMDVDKSKDVADCLIKLWDSLFGAATGFELENVTLRTRDMKADEKVSGVNDSNKLTCYPIECEEPE